MNDAPAPGDAMLLPRMWRRGLAGVLDTGSGVCAAAALVYAGIIDVSFWLAPVDGLLAPEAFGLRLVQEPGALLRLLVLIALPLACWHAAWGLTRGGTPGERIARLAVVDRDGRSAGGVRRVVRGAMYVALGPLLLLPLLFPWVSRTQRGLPDLVARTWVVDARCVPFRGMIPRRGPSSPTGSRPA